MNFNQLAFMTPINQRMIQTAEKLSQQQRNEQKTREVVGLIPDEFCVFSSSFLFNFLKNQ